MDEVCLQASDSRCPMNCRSGPFKRCRKRLLKELMARGDALSKAAAAEIREMDQEVETTVRLPPAPLPPPSTPRLYIRKLP